MPAPRGIPAIEVTFDIDANGILSVSAKDKATGKQNSIRIEGGSQLTKEEIEKMKADAEANAESDRLEKEKVDKINAADSMIFQTEKQIKEFGEKLSEEDKNSINEKLEVLKKAHADADVVAIDSSIQELNDTWGPISTKLYQEGNNDSSNNSESKDEDSAVEDVDFEDVK
jgi:molecular chaperone DnaK